MIKAVLLDLDETLLQNPPDRFAKAYISDLITHFLEQFPSLEQDSLLAGIRMATVATIQNQDPLRFNSDVFYNILSQQVNLSRNEMLPAVDSFVENIYPRLQTLTSTIDAALSLVEWLLDNDYAVAIATNPLFPHQATLKRVLWANIDPSKIWFISTLDSVHFTKPNPAYYEEVLTRIGFEPDETLMVGDDWQNDIIPATLAGFNTFYIRPASTPNPADNTLVNADGVGTLDELLQACTKNDWLQSLTPRPLTTKQIAPRYLGNIAALHGFGVDIQEHHWNQHPDPNEWSPLEIVVHLLESECNVQRPRLETILAEDNPFLVNPPTPPRPNSRDLSQIDGQQTIEEFAAERMKTIDILSELSDEQWIRTARHSVFGPTSLLEMAAFTARHDHLHINQLCQTLGKCL